MQEDNINTPVSGSTVSKTSNIFHFGKYCFYSSSHIYLFFTVRKESQPPQETLALDKQLQKQQSNDNAKVQESNAKDPKTPNSNINTPEHTNTVS
jgi:hypothetical protein